MKRVVVDTNVLIKAFKSAELVFDHLSKYDELLIPLIVAGEFKAGLFDTKAGRETRELFNRYCNSSGVKMVGLTDKTVDLYAKIHQILRAAGTPIPSNDIWIAALAFEHSADLATNDAHFNHIPMLGVTLIDQ